MEKANRRGQACPLSAVLRLCRSCLLVLAFGVVLAMSASAAGSHRIVCTVAGYDGVEPIPDFPVLVRLSEQIEGFSYADCRADGADVTFALPDGTPLAREIDTWNPAGESLLWVRLPELKQGLVFHCFYNDPAATEQPACQGDGSVWAGAYAGVWHFSEADGVVADSTVNGLDAVPKKAVANSIGVPGRIGTARQNAVGTSDGYLSVQNYDHLGLGARFTMSGWILAPELGGFMRIFSRKNTWNEASGWELEMGSGSYTKCAGRGASATSVTTYFKTSLKDTWKHVALVFDDATLSIFENGELLSSGPITPATDNGKPLSFGDNSNGSESHFRGLFDEFRLAPAVTTPERLKAEHDSVSDAGYVTFGAALPMSGSLIVSGLPGDYGVAVPAYGIHQGVTPGATVAASAPSVSTNAAGDMIATCLGWDLYDEAGEIVASGTGHETSFVFKDFARLVWRFKRTYKVEVTTDGGPVTGVVPWADEGTELALVAEDDGDHTFFRWRGSLPEGTDPASPLLAIVVKGPISVKADFSARLHVSLSGDDANDGATWETALANPQTAVDRAEEGDIVLVDDGTYRYGPTSRDGSILTIDKNVFVLSRNGPSTTILDAGRDNKVNCRGLTISNVAPGSLFCGFTVTNGSQKDYYVTSAIESSAGVISNCLVFPRYQTRAAFVQLNQRAVMRNSVIDAREGFCGNAGGRNAAVQVIGDALLENCVVRNMDCGENAYPVRMDEYQEGCHPTVRGCVITNNVNGDASRGKGYGAVYLYNGILENCTIVGNKSYGMGAGVYVTPRGGNLANVVCRNNIIWGNEAMGGFDDLYGDEKTEAGAAVAENCCASDLTFGERGNINVDPLFVDRAGGNLSLQAVSPCVGRALDLPWMAGALDLRGNPRVFGQGPDIGALESQERIEGIAASCSVKRPMGRAPFAAEFVSTVVGDLAGLRYSWDFGDGATGEGPSPTHTYVAPGAYEVALTVSNGAGERETVLLSERIVVVPGTCHVSPTGSHQVPYATWETAATNVADALLLNPAEVLVADGTYLVEPTGLVVPGGTTLRSVNGPSATVLDTGLEKAGTSRLLWLQHEGSVVSGFTLRHGSAGTYYYQAAIKASAGLVTNCVVTDTLMVSRSAIVLLEGTARMAGCTVRGTKGCWNTDYSDNSAIAMHDDALVWNCIVTNFTQYSNRSDGCPSAGISLHDRAVLRNSLVIDCDFGISWDYGKGATNMTGLAGGVILADGTPTVENCTVVGNEVATAGGGISVGKRVREGAIIRNNIVWGNSARWTEQDIFVHPEAAVPVFVANCTPVQPSATATGTVTADPLFRPGKWTLGFGSPCINAGVASDWMAEARDLAGNPRIRNRIPDLGCYEGLLPGGTLIILR